MQRKLIASGGAALVLLIAGAVAFHAGNKAGGAEDTVAQAQQGPPPATVATAKATLKSLAPQSETPGSVVSTRDSLVAAATAGKIEWVAEIGAEVEEGDVIARIEKADAEYTRGDAAAELKRLRARLKYQEALVARFEGLGEDGGESESSMDEMRAIRDEARQSLARAQVALERAQINLQRTQVVAPFAGRIVSQEAQIGEYANPGTEIVRLVDTHRLEVTTRAPAGLARNVAAGMKIPVINGGDTLEGAVRAVVPVGDALSRMLELRIELPRTAWYIGSAVRVRMPSAPARKVVAVPRDALVLRAERISVFVIDDENVAKRVDVELGTAEGAFIEVVGDIKDGDNVVTRGGERLRDGHTVSIAPPPETSSA